MATHALSRADSDRHLEALIAEGVQWSFQIACVMPIEEKLTRPLPGLSGRDTTQASHDATPFMKSLHSAGPSSSRRSGSA
jgi:hypothetical protein